MPSLPPVPWRLLQLADAAFPSGGFAHSGGIEASVQLGGTSSPEALLEEALWQAGRAALPFVGAAARAPNELPSLDARCDALLASHVANRASRALGRALSSAASRAFDGDANVGAVAAHAQRGTSHQAPVFGALFGALGLSARDAQIAFLHGTARQTLSSAVRLGLVGPLEAQAIQAERTALFDRVLARCAALSVEEAGHAAPLLDLWGALHDRLDARMFQS